MSQSATTFSLDDDAIKHFFIHKIKALQQKEDYYKKKNQIDSERFIELQKLKDKRQFIQFVVDSMIYVMLMGFLLHMIYNKYFV